MTSTTNLAIKPMLEDGRENELADLLKSLHPADLADALEPLGMEDIIKVVSLLDNQTGADVLVELNSQARDQVAQGLPVAKLTSMVSEMESDDAADLVGELSDVTATEVLSHIDSEDSEEVRRLLMYDGESAGGLMQLELVSVLATDTVPEAVDKIRKKTEEVGDIGHVFVVDALGSLCGEVSLKDLLLAKEGQTMNDLITKTPGLVLHVDEDQESVAQKFQKYDVKVAPVVDNQNRLLGRVTVDDIIDVVHEETDKDFYRLAGSSEEELYVTSTVKTAGLRIPWLLFNLGGGVITSLILSAFQASLEKTMVLVAFVPMVMSISGAVGSQSATITVRGLATGRLTGGNILKNLGREQRITSIIAFSFGIVIAFISGSLNSAMQIGLAVGLSMTAAILVSAFLGAVTPIFFKTVKIDPAMASGPVVTSINDVVSLLIYTAVGTAVV
ncbi:MAG: magnesium transporter [Deltaproteobacteria bacterium]|jgi:magnesium transporter|nr:magnesium transporter [Deltaproteobacteria bacterium]